MMNNLFLCFVGVDGSGKSTLTERVFNTIKKKDNKKVIKVYGRYQPALIKYLRAAAKALILRSNSSNYDNYFESKKALFRKVSMVSKVYISIIIIEYYLQLVFKIAIPLRLGYSVIADRYVLDTMINDIAIDTGLTIKETRDLLRCFSSFVPKPDVTFFLQVPEHVALKRKNDIPSQSFLKLRKKYYEEISLFEQTTTLDGTLEISELEHRVFSEVSKKKKKGN